VPRETELLVSPEERVLALLGRANIDAVADDPASYRGDAVVLLSDSRLYVFGRPGVVDPKGEITSIAAVRPYEDGRNIKQHFTATDSRFGAESLMGTRRVEKGKVGYHFHVLISAFVAMFGIFLDTVAPQWGLFPHSGKVLAVGGALVGVLMWRRMIKYAGSFLGVDVVSGSDAFTLLVPLKSYLPSEVELFEQSVARALEARSSEPPPPASDCSESALPA